MKYIQTRPSKSKSFSEVHEFAVGTEELHLLHAIVESACKYTPKTIESSIMYNRIANFKKVLFGALKKQDRSK